MTEGAPPPPRRTFADKLEHLFHEARGPGGEYTLEQVAQGIRDLGGPTISLSYIWQLRKGHKTNPTKDHIEALAAFFGVPAAYFFDDKAAAAIDAELGAALRDPRVRRVALRAAGLPPGILDAIHTIIESARQIQGLPDEEKTQAADAAQGAATAPVNASEPTTARKLPRRTGPNNL